MSENKHTPGPWRVGQKAQIRTAGDYFDQEIVSFTGQQFPAETVEANARLIAAAPEMLDALDACNARLHMEGYTVSDPVTDMVIAAIAKARGETK